MLISVILNLELTHFKHEDKQCRPILSLCNATQPPKFLIFQAVPKNMPVSVHTITVGHAEIPRAVAGVCMALLDASQMNYENILRLNEQL